MTEGSRAMRRLADPGGCPVCGEGETISLIDIPGMPVYANQLWQTQEQARSAPRGDLALRFCTRCAHVFNAGFDPQQMQYSPEYENSLHFSPKFQEYAVKLAHSLVDRHGLYRKKVLEIGCGQGDFLEMVCTAGNNRGLGFDPSYKEEGGPGLERPFTIVRDYYSEKYSRYPADVIICRQVLEHLPRPGEFLASVRLTIGERDSLVFFEVPNVLYTLRELGIWDLIYEHYSYFSPISLGEVFAGNDFRVLHIEETFGGQFLTVEARSGVFPFQAGRESFLEAGLPDTEEVSAFALSFAEHYHKKVREWELRLEEAGKAGKSIVLWGGGSKGVTFLNVMHSTNTVDTVIDINPRKQGKFVSGSGEVIQPPKHLKEKPADVILVMNPNYLDEIRKMLGEMQVEAELWLV